MSAVPHRPSPQTVQPLELQPLDVAFPGHFDPQLRQLQKMEIVGALAGGVAHDFNNLLMAIRGNIELLLMDSKIDPAIRARLEQVELAGTRASELAQRLLTVSRSAAKKVDVIDFNRVIQEAAQLATCALRSRVAITVTGAPEPARVLMDFAEAVQVILTLCLNAGEAMPPNSRGGQVKLTNMLAAARAVGAGGEAIGRFLSCSVEDTGSGIAPENLSRIFAPFFTTKPAGKGTGLGLARVREIVESAGGFMEVESKLGAGTTFQVLLPLRDS